MKEGYRKHLQEIEELKKGRTAAMRQVYDTYQYLIDKVRNEYRAKVQRS